MKNKTNFTAYLCTYPSRKCGIATFTQDLCSAIDKLTNPQLKSMIIALNDNGNSYDYGSEVMFQINDTAIQDYFEVAQRINEDDRIKLVSVQHEFKIFGSSYGENLPLFLEALEKPVITTLHTVLPNPSDYRKKIVQLIAEKSDCLIVMNKFAVEILRADYALKDSKIIVIPHGVHDEPYTSNTPIKKRLGYANKQLITSFGFLRPGRGRKSSGKGYEYVLDALPAIIKQFPNVLYQIIGITHPKTLKEEDEKYREFLESKVKELGLGNNVRFINKYVNREELSHYLKASDVYVCSSLNPNQIVSGTLSYALACGRPVVSTPFLHAREVVSPERGLLCRFKDPDSFSKAILHLLNNPSLREDMGRNAYAYTRYMTWPNIAMAYQKVFKGYLATATGPPLPAISP